MGQTKLRRTEIYVALTSPLHAEKQTPTVLNVNVSSGVRGARNCDVLLLAEVLPAMPWQDGYAVAHFKLAWESLLQIRGVGWQWLQIRCVNRHRLVASSLSR